MTKPKNPLFSLGATGSLGDIVSFTRRRGTDIVEKKPVPPDAKSVAQLSWRHMYQKCIALWHLLSPAEKQEWESNARPHHMVGYAWFISQCLRPNPGIYLPLQGGTMQGDIDMDGNRLLGLPAPVLNGEPVVWGDERAARVYHTAAQSIPNITTTTLAFNSERYDTDAMHDVVTNNSRLTCKAAGKHIIIANIGWAGNAAGIRYLFIYLNGATYIALVGDTEVSANAEFQVVSTLYNLALNDYVEAKVYQDSGGALNVISDPNACPEFMMQRLP